MQILVYWMKARMGTREIGEISVVHYEQKIKTDKVQKKDVFSMSD